MSKTIKKIGISSCFLYPDKNRLFFGPKTLCYIENDMAQYLYSEQQNIIPVLIPNFNDDQLKMMSKDLDGLVLQGGSDLSPEKYNQPFLDKSKWPGDPYRDDYELKLIKYFHKQNKPILGICRGAQVLNAYFGGTLDQDIPTLLETNTIHRDANLYDNVNHEITIQKDSILYDIYNKENFIVNSVHHQSIKKLGKDLKIEAISTSDNIIEAFSLGDNIIGVQWHPEFMPTLESAKIENLLDSNPLLNYFFKRL